MEGRTARKPASQIIGRTARKLSRQTTRRLDGQTARRADALKAYGSTIEEARADLFGLYYVADPKPVELGLTPSADAYKAQYYTYLMNGLMTQLVRIEPGNNCLLYTSWM